MVQMDPLAMTISGIVLIGALIVVLKFVSDRPKRTEMQDAIDRTVKPIADNVQYIREQVDQLPKRRVK